MKGHEVAIFLIQDEKSLNRRRRWFKDVKNSDWCIFVCCRSLQGSWNEKSSKNFIFSNLNWNLKLLLLPKLPKCCFSFNKMNKSLFVYRIMNNISGCWGVSFFSSFHHLSHTHHVSFRIRRKKEKLEMEEK